MWQETLNKIQTADAVLVILEPYREIINPEGFSYFRTLSRDY